MKAEKLLECLVTGAPKPITDEQITEAEKKLNLRFPSEFKRFVAKWNGVELDGCDWSSPIIPPLSTTSPRVRHKLLSAITDTMLW